MFTRIGGERSSVKKWVGKELMKKLYSPCRWNIFVISSSTTLSLTFFIKFSNSHGHETSFIDLSSHHVALKTFSWRVFLNRVLVTTDWLAICSSVSPVWPFTSRSLCTSFSKGYLKVSFSALFLICKQNDGVIQKGHGLLTAIMEALSQNGFPSRRGYQQKRFRTFWIQLLGSHATKILFEKDKSSSHQ
jgi:hypothetical protein